MLVTSREGEESKTNPLNKGRQVVSKVNCTNGENDCWLFLILITQLSDVADDCQKVQEECNNQKLFVLK